MDSFMKSKSGRILISIVWGLGLAAILRQTCSGPKCLIVQGPDPSDVRNKVYRYKDKCVTFHPVHSECKQ